VPIDWKQMINKLLKSLILPCCLGLSACTTPITPDFSGMSSNYALILEQYQINGLLLNIVRASNNRPLSFLDIPNITGTGSISVSPSLGATWYGIGNTIANATPNLFLGGTTVLPMATFGNSFNFSQSSLDNATFTKGFLSNINLEAMQYFSRHHIPSELMFTLLVDSIEYQIGDSPPIVFTNDPTSPEYPKFQEEMYKLLKFGLVATSSSYDIKDGDIKTESELIKEYGAQYDQVLESQGIEFKLIPNKKNTYQLYKKKNFYRLCMKQGKFTDLARKEFAPDTFCKPANKNANLPAGKTNLQVNLRSTFDVFMFLGQLVKVQNAEVPLMVKVPPMGMNANQAAGEGNRYAVLVVNKNKDTAKTFSKVEVLNGDVYSIPEADSGYSTLVINLLSQLLTLNKVPGSIPSSPAVLIQGGKSQ
jgi:hypothetical protein